MDKQVVAVLQSIKQKEGVLRELELKNVDRENVKVIHKDEDNAPDYRSFFEQGDYVVVVEVEREIGRIPVEEEDTQKQKRTPKGHHHKPHHQMREGL